MSKSVERCCVKGCNSVSGKQKVLTFHRFPKSKKQILLKTNYFGTVQPVDKLIEWKKALKINIPHPRMRVCSLHFKHSDYVLPDYPSSHKILVKSAVPSLNLPVSPKERENSERDEARLKRIIQREIAKQHNHFHKSPSNETDEQAFQDHSSVNEENESVVDSIQDGTGHRLQNKEKSRVNKESESGAVEKPKEKVVKYCFSDTLDTDEKVCTATGIATIKTLDTIISIVKEVYGDRFEKCRMKTRDRVILTYLKMKHNTSYRLLSLIFTCVSSQVCQKIFLTTIEVLSKCLSPAIHWPSREEISRNLPVCFEGFEDTRIVIDCTEIFIQHPKNLCHQLRNYLQHKDAATVKFLIGVSPAGSITYVSPAYGGRTSDTAIFTQSKLMTLLEPNDAVMVNKGFMIKELCIKNKWKLIRPPFLKDKEKFSETESIATSKITGARVHIERIKQRLKVWSIVGSEMTSNLLPVASEILNILCATVNLSEPILQDDKFINNK